MTELLSELMAPLTGGHTTNRRPKDSGRAKVYEAERATEWTEKAKRHLTEKEMMADIRQIAKYADKLTGKHYAADISVRFHRGGGARAFPFNLHLEFGRDAWASNRWTICHEVAHLYNATTIRRAFGWTEEQRDGRSHGREWAALYIALVSHWCGTASATSLKAEMRKRKVRYTPKRIMSPEQKAAAAARLAEHRPTRVVSTTTYAVRIDIPEEPGEFEAVTVWFTGRSGDRVLRPRQNNGRGYRVHYEVSKDPVKAVTRKSLEAAERALARARWLATDDRKHARIVEVEP